MPDCDADSHSGLSAYFSEYDITPHYLSEEYCRPFSIYAVCGDYSNVDIISCNADTYNGNGYNVNYNKDLNAVELLSVMHGYYNGLQYRPLAWIRKGSDNVTCISVDGKRIWSNYKGFCISADEFQIIIAEMYATLFGNGRMDDDTLVDDGLLDEYIMHLCNGDLS